MATLLLRNLPDDLYQRLKQRALQNHRSLASEALALLENALAPQNHPAGGFPQPFVGRSPLTDELLNEARQTGRA
jgi:hypothetical protein